MATLAHAELFVLALITFAALSSAFYSVLSSFAPGRLSPWEPSQRYVALWLLCVAPLFTTCALFLAAIGPAAWSLVEPTFDHCLVHDDGHAHLCFVHRPHFAPHAMLWVGTTFATVFCLIQLVRTVRHLVRESFVVRTLARTGKSRSDGTIEVSSETPVCVSAGLWRPRVLVSPSLAEALEERHLSAVLAHEASHVRRRDALSLLIARSASVLYVPSIRRRLERALRLAAEQACDEVAARQVGDRMTVAEAILAVARVGRTDALRAPLVTMGMAELAIESRVTALLGSVQRAGNLRGLLLPAFLCAAALAWNADALHHAVESLLSHFLS